MSLKRVLIMAGGTGGHVFPGIAVAENLYATGVEIHWMGTPSGLEAKILPSTIIFHPIEVNGLRGKGWRSLVLAPFTLLRALYQACQVLAAIKPDVVLGMGGFVSGPGGLAAWLMRYPLVIHEQNAVAGMTNKLLAPLAKYVLEGFPEAFARKSKVMTVGNPVRSEILAIRRPALASSTHSSWTMLVLGGSLGAQVLNQVLPAALARLPQENWPTILHQTGEKHWQSTLQAYAAQGIELSERVQIVPFITAMDAAYTSADMVLCRAGALTVAELCAAGVGAMLVPYPHAVDDHQTANASYMVKQGAAVCVQQAELTADYLANLLLGFALSPEKRKAMSEAAFTLRQDQVVEKIVNLLHKMSEKRR